MNTEHILAIVEPTDAGEVTLDHARDVVARGGAATVVVLADKGMGRHIREFAEAEGLGLGEAGAMYADRLAAHYAARVGVPETSVSVDMDGAWREVFARTGPTAIVLPQHLLVRREWRTAVETSRVPVTITPPRAA